MNLFVSTSIVSAFIAGVAALFAPCCISVLLPSYLGSIFRERRRVFLMTFVFFLGILTIFLPLGLGSAAFGQFLNRYHRALFAVGGALLLGMGATQLLGWRFSLPFHVNPQLKNPRVASVFTLGIFSGLATTCCAPVLAGVLALAALPGSVFLGLVYTLSYVLGMVTPLFILSLVLDRSQATSRIMLFRRPVTLRLLGRSVQRTPAELLSGVVFVAMGSFILWQVLTDRLSTHSAFQLSVNVWLSKVLRNIQGAVAVLPEFVWAAIVLGAFVLLLLHFLKLSRKPYEEN